MDGSPGAASRLRRRLEGLAEEWPGVHARAVAAVVEHGASRALDSLSESPPHWLSIPCAIAASTSRMGDRLEAELDEVLWGQLCLFLTIRIQDDLLDGHTDDAALQFVADRFLVESLRTFEDRGLPAAFRRELLRCLGETSDGILEVHELERAWGGFREAHLPLHAKASSVLKVGTLAVCHRLETVVDRARLEDLLDRLVVVGQICDDLQDLDADLSDGRYTWVANHLGEARPGEVIDAQRARRRVSRGLLSARRTAGIFEVARRNLAVGRRRAKAAGAPPPILARIGEIGAGLDTLETGLHEARVSSVLGDAAAASASELPPARDA